MNSYLDFVPVDCMDIVIEKRITDMEKEVSNIKDIVIKKLEDNYEKEKKRKPGKFNFEAFRIAVDIKVFINEYEKTTNSDDEDEDEDEDEYEEEEEEEEEREE
jgi:hypothetical protein